jgi:UDP-N-acetylglucosamine--N-acetylmuramyl-(pentapeptide) pyrophosphoryl-undecaprenol N-acetylglucosamine transferase
VVEAGGHIYPAIAIAYELKPLSAEFLFVGAKDKMEMQKYRKPVFKLGVCGLRLQRKISLQNLMFPFSMDLWKAKK